MTRRRFIQTFALVTVTGGAALWIVGTQSLGVRAQRVVDYVWSPARRIKRHFSYLNLDPSGVDAYIRAYEQNFGLPSRLHRWPSLVYTRYLLSTDFFRHDADESRPVRYVALYEPTLTLCNNPLARFD